MLFIAVLILIVTLSLNKDNWDPTTIDKLDQPAPAFPKGDSLLTINSEGDLSAQLSDENMNSYFKTIDTKISQLIDTYNDNMSSLKQQYDKDILDLKSEFSSWKAQADDVYVKHNNEIMLSSMADNWGWLYTSGSVAKNSDMNDFGGDNGANQDTPSKSLGFIISKKSNLGAGKEWQNGGWRCPNGNVSPHC